MAVCSTAGRGDVIGVPPIADLRQSIAALNRFNNLLAGRALNCVTQRR
jgi:hypothetical protein